MAINSASPPQNSVSAIALTAETISGPGVIAGLCLEPAALDEVRGSPRRFCALSARSVQFLLAESQALIKYTTTMSQMGW